MEYAEIFLTILGMGMTGFFAYHKFLINLLERSKKEIWKEINKLQAISDKRDEEIKDLIKDMKIDIKNDLNFIKERIFPK